MKKIEDGLCATVIQIVKPAGVGNTPPMTDQHPQPQPAASVPMVAENLSSTAIDAALIQALTTAIHELAYSINTSVISSLAIDEESRKNVIHE